MSFYMPLYVDIDGLPAFCETFLPGEGANTSLFWEFKELCILTQRRFARHMEITGKAKREWEAHAAAVLAAHSRDMAQLPESGAAPRAQSLTAPSSPPRWKPAARRGMPCFCNIDIGKAPDGFLIHRALSMFSYFIAAANFSSINFRAFVISARQS